MPRRYIAATTLPALPAAKLIKRVDPGYPDGNDKGLANPMEFVDENGLVLPQGYTVLYDQADVGFIFENVQLGRPKNSRCDRGDSVAFDKYIEVNTNKDFDDWPTPTQPARWGVGFDDESSFVSKDYVQGNPIAATFTCDGSKDIELILYGITANVSSSFPYSPINRDYDFVIKTEEPSTLEIYAAVDNIGDLNGGNPVNGLQGDVVGIFSYPSTELQGAFRLVARPSSVAGQAAIESVSVREQVNTLTVESRDEWTLLAGPVGVPNVPLAYPRWQPGTTYGVDDKVWWGYQWRVCATGGVSGTQPPAWDASGSIADGSVVWNDGGNYFQSGLMVLPDLVDIYSAGNTVQATPPGGGPDIWGYLGDLIDSAFDGTKFFINLPEPQPHRVLSNTTTASMHRTIATADVDVGKVSTTWHTTLAIIHWNRSVPPAMAIEIQMDFVPYLTITIPPDGAPHSVAIDQPADVAEAFVAGNPMALGKDIYAYWVCYRFNSGAFPPGADFARFRWYPGGNAGGNAGTGGTAICLQDALGVKGPYWPATVPYRLDWNWMPGDQLQLEMDLADRFDPRRGTLFLMASPIRNESTGQVIAPPSDEILVGIGDDCLFGIDTENYVYASQGKSRQYISRSQSPITDYPPDYFVVTWDAYENRMVIYTAWSRTGVTPVYEAGIESGCIQFDGDGSVLSLSSKIYRSWHILHASIFDQAFDAETVAGMLP